MTMTDPVRYIIAANYQHGTTAVSERAKAYVLYCNWPSVHVVVRSRGGRWITTWVQLKHLGNFRIKTVVELGCPAEVWRSALEDRESLRSDLSHLIRNREQTFTIDRDLGDEDKHP